MKLSTAKALALDLMTQHGITGWSLIFDRAVRRLGLTHYSTRTIRLSKALTLLNDEAQVKNTILHEIAHVLVGHGNGHNDVWRSKAISIGCNGQRCTDSIVTVQPKYKIVCTHCNASWGTHRKPKNLGFSWHKICGRVSQNKLVLQEVA